jgi:hypothetical protein
MSGCVTLVRTGDPVDSPQSVNRKSMQFSSKTKSVPHGSEPIRAPRTIDSFIPVHNFAESSSPQASKIRLHITDPAKRTSVMLLQSTDKVEQVLVATGHQHARLHVYFNGKKLRPRRSLSYYQVTDGSRLDIRMFAWSYSNISFVLTPTLLSS